MQAAVIKGKDILNILNKLNNPADIDEIVNQIAPNCQQSKTKLLGTVKNALEAGIEYGYIVKNDDNKYQVENLGRSKKSDFSKARSGSDSEMDEDVHQEGNASTASKKNVTKLPSTRKKLNLPFKHKHLYSSSSEDDETAFPYGYKLQDQQEDCCRRARKPRCRRPRRRKSSCRRRRKRRCR